MTTLSFDSTNTGERTLTPATQTTLAKETDYFLLFRNGASGTTDGDRARVDAKLDGVETGEVGWEIADHRLHREGTGTWSFSSYSLKLEVVAEAANIPATGRPTISGTPRVGQTLTAATSAIADSDGLGTFTFQWARFAADGTTREATIGTNSRTYTLTDDEENKRVKVSVTFTDGEGNSEGPLTSAAFPSAGTIDDEPDDGDDPPDDGDDPPDDGDDDEPGGGDDGQDEPVETPALPLAGAAVLAALLAAAGARARRA